MANEQNLKPFKKGDYRINRRGRPRSFDKLRELAQQIAIEPAIDSKTNQPIVINDKIITQIEAMFRQMIRDPKRSALFLEYAYGKPKSEIDIYLKRELDEILDKLETNLAPDVYETVLSIIASIGTK